MVINFRTREISRETCKLTQTPMLIIIIKKKSREAEAEVEAYNAYTSEK
jgi:hypothetical protein